MRSHCLSLSYSVCVSFSRFSNSACKNAETEFTLAFNLFDNV